MEEKKMKTCRHCRSEIDAKAKVCPHCGKKQGAPGCLIILLVIVVLAVIGGAIGGGSDSPSSSSGSGTSQQTQQEEKKDVPPIAVDQQLSAGNYVVGVDIPAGTYNFTAVSGGGNVSSDNMYSGGINAIMGTADKNTSTGTDMYQQEYKNIKLPEGTTLRLAGSLVLQVTCPEASGAPLTPRNQSITEAVELSNGNYVAGTDFPAGTYDITVVSGSGNVSSSNLYDGGINEVMGTKNAGFDMYIQQFLHVELPQDVTLTIQNVKIKLTPSK